MLNREQPKRGRAVSSKAVSERLLSVEQAVQASNQEGQQLAGSGHTWHRYMTTISRGSVKSATTPGRPQTGIGRGKAINRGSFVSERIIEHVFGRARLEIYGSSFTMEAGFR